MFSFFFFLFFLKKKRKKNFCQGYIYILNFFIIYTSSMHKAEEKIEILHGQILDQYHN